MEKTVFEIFFDWLGILSFAAIMIYLLIQWSSIPSTVPIHFNVSGEADGWGPKWMLFLLPFVGIILWVGMYFLEKQPQIHNYLNLREDNIRAQYKNSQFLVNVMKNEVLIFFAYFTWTSIHIASGQEDSLGVWTMPVFLTVIFGSMGFFIVRSFRL